MYNRKKLLFWQCNELLKICIFPRIEALVFLVCHKTNERLELVASAMSQSLSVCGGRSLLRTVNAWEMRQLLVADVFQRRPFRRRCCRQALRGAQGHPWSGVGREGLMRNRPSLSLPLSPLKPSKHCPAACCTAMWTQLSVSQNSLAYHTKSLFSETDKNQEEQRKRNIPGSGISPRNS